MENNKLANKLLDSIKEENITPKPRWVFLFRNYFLWGVSGAFVLVGGISVSVIIYVSRYSEWGVYRQLTDGWPEFLLLVLPVFWLVLLGLAVALVVYDLKHTKKGYKYSLTTVATTVILASALLGVFFFYTGMGRAIDNVLGSRAPYYSQVINPRVGFWCQPDQGRLAGIIASIVNEDEFILGGCLKRSWTVEIGGQMENSPSRQKNNSSYIKVGVPVRVIGQRTSEAGFTAREILPMHMGGNFFRHHMEMRHMMTPECSDCIHR